MGGEGVGVEVIGEKVIGRGGMWGGRGRSGGGGGEERGDGVEEEK